MLRLFVGLLLAAGADLASAGAAPGIDAAHATVERAALDDAQREAANADLDAAAELDKAARALVARVAELKRENAEWPAHMAKLQESVELDRDRSVAEWARRLPKDADGETLERLLEQERRTIAEIQAQIDAAGTELALVLSRPAESAGEIAALRGQIEELSLPIAAQEDEPAALRETRRLRRASELRRAQAELELRLTEQETAAQRQRHHELTLREARHRLGLHQRRAELLQQRIVDLGRQEIESLRQRLAEQEQRLAGAPSVVALAASENRALADELMANQERLARDRASLVSIEEESDYVRETLRDSRTRLELGATNERVGRWLWSERRRLQPTARLRERLESTRVTLADLRLRLLTLDDEQRELADVPAAARALLEAGAANDDEDGVEEVSADLVATLMRERVELLTQLRPVLERRVAALEQGERSLSEQLNATDVLQKLLDRHLLWLPSHGLADRTWLQRVPEGLADPVKASRFATTLELCAKSLRGRPALWLGSFAVLMALVALRLRAPVRIVSQAIVTKDVRQDSYAATVSSLAWTVLGALPAPVGLGLLGLLLQQVGNAGRFSDSLGRACAALVVPLLAVQVLRWAVIEGGLAHAHFRWLRQRRESLRQWLPVGAAIVLPMFFVIVLATVRRVDLAIDVQARIALVVSAVALAWILWRVLEAGRVWSVRGITVEPSVARRTLRVLLPALLLAHAGLALAGYVYSAGVLLESVLASFGVIVGVALVLGLAARWFLLGERRLALRRLEERREAAEQAAAEAGEAPPPPEEAVTLEQVGAQTARLLRALRVSLLALGLVVVWSGVLPAIYRLDEIALWHVTDTAADGATIEQPVTLAALLIGLFALALTVAGSRNLPGLIELTLLSRAGIDAASRYAITSVLRYAIVIGGTVAGLSLLGLRWSQLQWMAAALTVGLGFGLQEIFANFVSGLILLFERPFRVGDVVTVGDLSGRVTRIRTRATTILDFDNKEIVVPNKTLITGQLVNWTLTDTTTRVTIKVGVAHGANPTDVRGLLMRAAQEDPRVLKDPPPASWFLAFGTSTLDFELRVFVGTLADRLEVQNALNTRIVELLTQHGIKVASPPTAVRTGDVPV